MKAYLLPVLCALLPGLISLPQQAAADCLSEEQIQKLAGAYAARKPAANPPGLSIRDAECSRAEFNAILRTTLGEPVGYKAGLTNSAVQQRFRHASPVRGSLYEPMLLHSGATVPSLNACLERTISGWRFSPGEGRPVEFSFAFAPPDPDQAAP